MNHKVKICGLMSLDDIEAVNAAKPDYIGFVFARSRHSITPGQAKELRGALNPGIIPVGVFVNETIENILALVNENIISVIQLHGAEDEEFIQALKTKTDTEIIKAVSIEKTGDAQQWENSAADYLLLDNKGGATGKPFDHDLIGELNRPFFLAGGLNPENVTSAIKKTAAHAVDVSSGVEKHTGEKCPEKIGKFIKKVRCYT
ncbi:MAG: phosphoribosylanthranilate isomerase [Clostridiales bacterium]|jgi:phosphoribosylanthranilate isomerase|nr:phosphoribosylanthranilate isomerase [Clostridiales bacterium]